VSYDMKHLRQAVDRQIPSAPADEARLKDILGEISEKKQPRRARRTGFLSAAAAVIVVILTFLSILPDGPGQDHVGGPMSMGAGSEPRETAQPKETALPSAASESVQAENDEDMSLYQSWYSPDWGASMFPDEKEFGDVIIRKQEDGSLAFENKDGSEALPGRWQQAFAYFVTSGTGLVGNGEALALLGKDGLITDFTYKSLQYMGNRAAFVQTNQGTLSGLTLISVADGGYLNGKFYDEIGYTGDGKTTLFMGVRREMIQLEDGGVAVDRILSTDVMDTTGRIIVRCHELSSVHDGVLGVRMQENSDILLLDMDGNELYGGQEFFMVGDRRNGLQIVLAKGGWGVLNEDGSWALEPGMYSSVRFGSDSTFIITDYEDMTREINLQGEDVSSASLKLRMAVKKAAEKVNAWLDSFGLLGKIILIAAAWLLAVRHGHALRARETRHMLVTEAGWAALIFGLLLISHRETWEALRLWPTNTDTSGSLDVAWAYGILASGGLISMIGCWKWMRTPVRALIAGSAVLLIPWAIKCVFADMSVKDWRILSEIVFTVFLLLSVLLMKAGFVRRFLEWCKTLDTINEYGLWRRILWYALTLAAFVNFALGTYLSGQGMSESSLHTEILPGGGTAYDAAWMAEINETCAKWRASGEELDSYLTDGNWETFHTVRWMEENDIDRLTRDMIYRLSVSGTIELKREGMAQLYFYANDPGVRFLSMQSPVAKDGRIRCDSVILVPPDMEPMPEICATVSVTQPQIDWIASQRYYEIDMSTVLQDMGGVEGEDAKPIPGAADASASIIGGADSPASILVESSSASVIGGADQPTSILVK